MKNTYIFLLLALITFNSYGKSFTALDNTSIKNQLTNAKETDDDRLKIRLGFSTTSGFHREILLTIDERSTDGIDNGFDAVLKQPHPNDMYWMLNEDKFVIQAIKELQIDRVIPIGIKSMGDSTLQIKVTSLENPYPDMEVYLRDNYTMNTFDILNETFEFSLVEGVFNDKYSLVFKPKAEIQIITEVTFEDLLVFVGENSNFLSIRKPEEIILTNIAIFNMIGQLKKFWNSNLNENEMDLPIYMDKGVHLVVMNSNRGRILKKVIIK